MELNKRLLGENHPNYTTNFKNLALLCDSQGRFEEAESFYQQALEICDRTLGKDHPRTVKVRKNLESLRREMNSE